MSELESLKNWYAYNAVARRGYFETLAKLPAAELTKDRGASFPTMLDILGHSLGGTSMWIQRMSVVFGEPFEDYNGPEPDSLDDLRKFEAYTDGLVDRFFSQGRKSDLDQEFLVKALPPWWPQDHMRSVRNTLYHVVEHELQHRGELNALLWQINIDPPILSWDEFEERSARTFSGKAGAKAPAPRKR